MSDDRRCLSIDGKTWCHDNLNGTGAFKDSRAFFVKTMEKMDAGLPFRLVQNCKIQGTECFKRNIWNAATFFFLMMIAGIMLNFFHELLHYSFFISAGYPASFSFSAYSGFTAATGVPDFTDPSVSWVWWYFVIMGPILVINLLAVIVAMSSVNHDAKNPPFIDSRVSNGSMHVWKMFLKAIAYMAAFSVLINTILAPFYNIFYTAIGITGKTSDLALAWEVAVSIPDPASALAMQMTVFVTAIVLIACMILYTFLFNRRENNADS